jgi:hypothetical protein
MVTSVLTLYDRQASANEVPFVDRFRRRWDRVMNEAWFVVPVLRFWQCCFSLSRCVDHIFDTLVSCLRRSFEDVPWCNIVIALPLDPRGADLEHHLFHDLWLS